MILKSLPTWIMTNMMTPFMPSDHPWQGRWFGLREWHEHQTPFCREFDTVGWVILFCITAAIIITRI